MTDTVTPKIHIACLAAYNNGILHGIWIPANEGTDTIHVTIYNVLKTSPIPNAEEWAIHDYEGFGDLRIPEHCSVEKVTAMADLITKHGELAAEVLNHTDMDFEYAKKLLTEGYIGVYDSVADYAEQLTEDTIRIPSQLAYYIDYEAMARDMELNGDIFTLKAPNNQVHIFWNC